MRPYDYCIFLIGAPSYLFEASVSAILRTIEVFEPKEVLIYYSTFAKKDVEEKVIPYIEKFVYECNIQSSSIPREDIYNFLEDKFRELTRRGRGLLVPTAGSIMSIIYATYIATKHGMDIAHVLFPFKYWTGFYYPFIPRYLQPITILSKLSKNGQIEEKEIFNWNGPKINLNLSNGDIENLLKSFPELHREIAYLSFVINKKWTVKPIVNEYRTPELCIDITFQDKYVRFRLTIDDVVIDVVPEKEQRFALERIKINGKPKEFEKLHGVLPEVLSFMKGGKLCTSCKEDKCIEDVISLCKCFVISLGSYTNTNIEKRKLEELHQLKYLSGLIEISLDEFESGNLIIDTNLVFRGVHNYAAKLRNRLFIPYCVDAEITRGIVSAKELSVKILNICTWHAYKVLKHYCNFLPTSSEKCDFAISKADPDFIMNFYVLTCDKVAYETWQRLAINKYAKVRLLNDNYFKPLSIHEQSQRHFALIQLFAFFKLISKEAQELFVTPKQ